jgi:hypothetical protein
MLLHLAEGIDEHAHHALLALQDQTPGSEDCSHHMATLCAAEVLGEP